MNLSDRKILFNHLSQVLKKDPLTWSEIEVQQFLYFSKLDRIVDAAKQRHITGSDFL